MAHPVLDNYDALLADLDGTVFEGGRPIDGAAEGLAGRRVMYVTNNASRAPEQVARHLTDLGFQATAAGVLTSAMAACDLAREELSTRHPDQESFTAFIIGAESFKDLARAAGFTVVESADELPDVVLHGHNPETNWQRLSEGALAIRRGALYVASNLDTTLPSERGLLVGNGSMVAAVRSATGVEPISAGKPGPAMFHQAAQMLGATRPLAVGDRLDTDIAGGNAAGMDTLCTVTGVSGHWAILRAEPAHRPTFIAANLRDHLPGWQASMRDGVFVVDAGAESAPSLMAAEALAALAPLVWEWVDGRGGVAEKIEIIGSSDAATAALEAWR
ncbi:MAG TPA: HAD-IIA family hydrolase [Candidatus Corynebacterium gallistercoris]|uniref:HAD-IIA family hydrolase n=1 Tax=Candidatus Corynebacterium gallistercoris TaxID=2838530 RepID=A0A9D1RXZ2_9CORY|nr:HAD-IIA family hydrolase [Candidatus Corynebacterium gallistercoris]